MNALTLGATKAVLFGICWMALLVTLFRGIVGPLWGSATDLGVFGAVITLVGGLYGLITLGSIMINDAAKTLKSKDNQ